MRYEYEHCPYCGKKVRVKIGYIESHQRKCNNNPYREKEADDEIQMSKL